MGNDRWYAVATMVLGLAAAAMASLARSEETDTIYWGPIVVGNLIFLGGLGAFIDQLLQGPKSVIDQTRNEEETDYQP